MGVILSSPVIQVLDENGNPGIGYLLYSYEVGTTTPKNLYSDKDCTVPLSNPVVADSDGLMTVYMDGTYKLIMTSDTGTEVWSVQEVGEATTSGGTEYVYYVDEDATDQGATYSGGDSLYDILDSLAFTDSSATIVFRGPPTGSSVTRRDYYFNTSIDTTSYTALTFQFQHGAIAYLSSGVSLTTNAVIDAGYWQIFDGSGTVEGNPICDAIVPEWWGCYGNGSTDDTVFMTRAWNHYWQRDSTTGTDGRECLGKFVFTAGRNYRITTGLSKTISNNTIGGWHISGYGSKITSDLNSGYTISIGTTCTTRNLIIEGIYITGEGSETGAMYLDGGQETSAQYLYCLTVRDLQLFTCQNHGLYLHGSIFEATIKDCNIYLDTSNTVGSGVVFDPDGQNSGQLSLYDVNCYYGKYNFNIESTSYPSFFNCAGHEAQDYGYRLQTYNASLFNCYVENAWNSAPTQADGGAGYYLLGFGTVVNCFAGTNKTMKYGIELYVTKQTLVIGGTNNGLVAYGYIAGSANHQATITWMSSMTFVEKSYGAAVNLVHAGCGRRTTFKTTNGTTDETEFGLFECNDGLLERNSYKIQAFGNASGSGTKTLTLYVGSSSVDVISDTETNDWELNATIYCFDDDNQYVSWTVVKESTVAHGVELYTIDGTTNPDIKLTGTSSDTTSPITLRAFIIDRIS